MDGTVSIASSGVPLGAALGLCQREGLGDEGASSRSAPLPEATPAPVANGAQPAAPEKAASSPSTPTVALPVRGPPPGSPPPGPARDAARPPLPAAEPPGARRGLGRAPSPHEQQGWPLLGKPVQQWDEEDVALWLARRSAAPPELVQALRRDAVTGAVLASLMEDDFDKLGIQKFGHRRLLSIASMELRALSERQAQLSQSEAAVPPATLLSFLSARSEPQGPSPLASPAPCLRATVGGAAGARLIRQCLPQLLASSTSGASLPTDAALAASATEASLGSPAAPGGMAAAQAVERSGRGGLGLIQRGAGLSRSVSPPPLERGALCGGRHPPHPAQAQALVRRLASTGNGAAAPAAVAAVATARGVQPNTAAQHGASLRVVAAPGGALFGGQRVALQRLPHQVLSTPVLAQYGSPTAVRASSPPLVCQGSPHGACEPRALRTAPLQAQVRSRPAPWVRARVEQAPQWAHPQAAQR